MNSIINYTRDSITYRPIEARFRSSRIEQSTRLAVRRHLDTLVQLRWVPRIKLFVLQQVSLRPDGKLLTGTARATVNWIELLDLWILLEHCRDLVGSGLRRWFQQDQSPLKGRRGHQIDDPVPAHNCRLHLRRRLSGSRGGDRTGCTPAARPRRHQTHVTVVGASVDPGEAP